MKQFYILCFIFSTFAVFGQFPEGFESGVPPTGWIQFENGTGTTQIWETSTNAYAGVTSAYVRYENVVSGLAEDWLVSPAVTVNAGSPILEFYQAQAYGTDYGSVYAILVSTVDQTTTGSFVLLDSQVETDFGLSFSPHYVNLSAYAGQSVYIAFVMTNDDGDNWYIDDINLIGEPCVAPTNLTASNITETTADLTWTPFSSGVTFQTANLPTGSPAPTSGTLITGTTENLTSLATSTTYDYYVREMCSISDNLIIAGVYDGPLTGGYPKGVELYVIEDIADLSEYGLGSANNGGGSAGVEFTFPAISVSAGSYIHVTADSAGFVDYFGFDADYISGSMLINGDDAIELFHMGSVIDVFGEILVDGTGQPWEYLDGWAYRNLDALDNFGVWDISEWYFSGINANDGETSNATAAVPFPINTFTTALDVSPWTMISYTTACAPFDGDSLPAAIAINSLPFTDAQNTTNCFTDQTSNPSNDVFYQYIVTDGCVTSIDIDLCNSSYDTYLHIFDAQMNELDYNDDYCGLQSGIYDFAVQLDDTLIIVVEGYSSDNGDYEMNVTVNGSVTPISLLNQIDVFCGGESTGEATFGNGDPSVTYLWDVNAGSQTDSTAVGLSAGMYVVTATTSTGCVMQDTVTIVDLNAPITLSATTTPEIIGNDGSISLTIGGGAAPYTTEWYLGGTLIPDANNLVGDTTYSAIVTDQNGCMDSIDVYVESFVSLDELNAGMDISIYPNPNNGKFSLTVNGSNEILKMDVVNTLGQIVESVMLMDNPQFEIQLRNIESGSYMLRFETESGLQAIKRISIL